MAPPWPPLALALAVWATVWRRRPGPRPGRCGVTPVSHRFADIQVETLYSYIKWGCPSGGHCHCSGNDCQAVPVCHAVRMICLSLCAGTHCQQCAVAQRTHAFFLHTQFKRAPAYTQHTAHTHCGTPAHAPPPSRAALEQRRVQAVQVQWRRWCWQRGHEVHELGVGLVPQLPPLAGLAVHALCTTHTPHHVIVCAPTTRKHRPHTQHTHTRRDTPT